MAVAKSYVGLEVVKEPYTVGKKKYVDLKKSNGQVITARWYTEEEYVKYYGEHSISTDENDPYYKPYNEVLGFDKGYIWIFKCDNSYEMKDWFKSIGAEYRTPWHWGLPSRYELPQELPEGMTAYKLMWDDVKNPKQDRRTKSDEEIEAVINRLFYGENTSDYVGTIGDKVELELTVENKRMVEGYYGVSAMYTFKDANENVFLWSTTSKTVSFEVGETALVKGSIKKHDEFRGVKQTVLTRCRRG